MTNLIQTNITKLQRLTKYILMGLIVIIATRYIPDNVVKTKEIIMIGATSSISFAILDMISPAIRVAQSNQSTKPVTKSESESKPKPKVLVEAFAPLN